MKVAERIATYGVARMSHGELVEAIVGRGLRRDDIEALSLETVDALLAQGFTAPQATRLAAAFELGRRAAFKPPKRGEQCLDPEAIQRLFRPLEASQTEEFHVVLLDVRGRLMRSECVSRGGLTQCPVSPRDALRPAVREGAYGVVFVHNHPSGDPAPSAEDADLTERLRAAAEIVGVSARDHVIVAAGGRFSFVEAGRWRR